MIIVVKNGALYLSEAIESVINQTCRPDEVIVVDGASTDNTVQIARSYSEVRVIQQTDKSLANARNTGIEQSTGEFIAFLDHDDYWTLDKLETQMLSLANHPEAQYSYARVKLFLSPGYNLRPGFSQQQFEEGQVGRTPGTLIARRSLFHQIGGFNPEFSIGCDVDWFTRAKDHSIKASFIPKVLLHKRVHEGNLSGNVRANKAEILEVIKQSLVRQRRGIPL